MSTLTLSRRFTSEDGRITIIRANSLLMMKNGIPPVDHIITDPPYEKSLHESKNTKTAVRTDGGPELRALDFAPIDDIREEFISLAPPICRKWFIAFCTGVGIGEWAKSINASPMKWKRGGVWVKPDPAPQFNGQGPGQGTEYFAIAWAGKGHSVWNGGGKDNVYTHRTKNKDRHGEHPTEKPVSLMREIIQDFTQPGDLVFDPFMGSGTTGIACIQTGRRFLGVEKDERYYAIAHERITEALGVGQLYTDARKARRSHQTGLELEVA